MAWMPSFFALMRFFYIKSCSLSCFLAVGFCLLIRTLLYAFSICEYGNEIRYSLETIFLALMRFFYIKSCSLSCFLAIVGLGCFSLYVNLSSSLSFNHTAISLCKLKLSWSLGRPQSLDINLMSIKHIPALLVLHFPKVCFKVTK